MKLEKIVFSIIGLIFLVGCSAPEEPQEAPIKEKAQDAPSISFEGRSAKETTTWDQISNENNGFYADFDADGISDYAIMQNDTLFFRKGFPNNQYSEQIPIIKVKGEVAAYRIQDINQDNRADFVFFNMQLQGFHQINMGESQGKPYFGDAEVRNEDFDF